MDTVSTEELAAASHALDIMLEGIQKIRASGLIPTVEQLTTAALYAVEKKGKTEEEEKRFLAVLLAVSIARLVNKNA